MKDLRIGVIGGGVVGQATARTYLEHVKEVIVWDIVPQRCTNTLYHLLNVSDLILLCLPTPQQDGMGLNTSTLDNFFFEMSRPQCDANFVLRSTVPIGTTRRLRGQYGLPNLIHSPEFLTARCATADAQLPSRNIIGDPCWDRGDETRVLVESDCSVKLRNLYANRFPGTPTLLMSSDESEAVKLFQNGIFAATVSLWNELRTLADKLGLAWDTVRSAILADGRLGPSHTQVPGQDGQQGWGGACLPKDVSQLLAHFHKVGLPASVLDGAWERNWEHDRPRQDKPVTGTHRREQP